MDGPGQKWTDHMHSEVGKCGRTLEVPEVMFDVPRLPCQSFSLALDQFFTVPESRLVSREYERFDKLIRQYGRRGGDKRP